jgi:hypothetical protein
VHSGADDCIANDDLVNFKLAKGTLFGMAPFKLNLSMFRADAESALYVILDQL